MTTNGPTVRALGGPIAAVALLVVISVLRFVFPDTEGTMLFAVVPITLLGIMRGFRASLLAALLASGVALTWAATSGNAQPAEYVSEPLTFFVLGGLSGFFAKGALGDFNVGRARTCSQIRRAIARDHIGLHYQPIVRPTGELFAVEALARWHDPSRGIVAPVDFVPAAESDDRTIWNFTLHTLRQAVKDAQDFDDNLVVAVNVSPASLLRRELSGGIRQILSEGGLPASRLAVEVTESAISRDDESLVIEVLRAIKGIGVGMVAIDDFGIGHSSLARLGRLPIDVVKLDRTLVGDSASPQTAAIIQGMIVLAHAVDLTVVAEGVEDPKTWRWLVEANCDAIQGFHLSRPMPPDELNGWLQTQESAVPP